MSRDRSRFSLRRTRALERLLLVVLAALLLWSAPVSAYLGSDLSSVQADSIALRGTVRTTALLHYDVHEIRADGGLTLREYVTPTGTVFALSWFGPVPPDLQSLLGQYFPAYAAALAALNHPGLHRSVRIALPELIVESGGHLRSYRGRAYVPGLVPADVAVAELP